MTDTIFTFTSPLIKKAKQHHIPVITLDEKSFKDWKKNQDAWTKTFIERSSFAAKAKQNLIVTDKSGDPVCVLAGLSTPVALYDLAHTAAHIRSTLEEKFLKSCSFYIEEQNFTEQERERLHLGWCLSGYQFAAYKKNAQTPPALLLHKSLQEKRITAFCESLFMARNLINTPANDMGPEDMEKAARAMAETFGAKISVICDKDLLKKNFPLIYTVGEAAANNRRPRLIDISWGKAKDPAVTLVGKGVCFDTGGLNLKPGQYMALMKKDMGGAAHAMGVAYLIMAMKLPVRLRVLLPVVENSVSGAAFRPGDVIKSRKGIAVENTNTDAEGRLVLADSLTYACEKKPDILIDFATLTGSARAALGHDIPAMFSNNDKIANDLRDTAMDAQDPLWPMPLWQPYRKHIESQTGDILNSASIPGDLIYSALFLESFLPDKKTDTPDWVHIDTFAWQSHGHAGRPNGGSDCGLRAVFAFLEKKYK